MRLRATCPNADCGAQVRASLDPGAMDHVRCPFCATDATPHLGSNWRSDDCVQRCPCCGGAEFF
ncbi:MAG: hypothetical protein V3T70_01445, partial [Phycisphaerae bacterium]